MSKDFMEGTSRKQPSTRAAGCCLSPPQPRSGPHTYPFVLQFSVLPGSEKDAEPKHWRGRDRTRLPTWHQKPGHPLCPLASDQCQDKAKSC